MTKANQYFFVGIIICCVVALIVVGAKLKSDSQHAQGEHIIDAISDTLRAIEGDSLDSR